MQQGMQFPKWDQNCTGTPVTGVTCDKDPVIAWVFVVNHGEAIRADNKGLYGSECSLVFRSPGGRIFLCFFGSERC